MPRDIPPPTVPGRATGASGVRGRGEARDPREPRDRDREETEALALPADWVAGEADPDLDDLDDEPAELPPLSAAPIGTHDRPPTRVESPAGRRPPSSRQGPRPAATPAATAPERPEERIGTTLGAYRLHALIGKGGMGFVYRAEHVKLGREVALKLLRADYARRRDSVSRFFQEARTVNRIRHRNIVDVTDFVELDDGTTYIIMELLRGQSLGSWARHSFDLARALGLLLQICDGLAAAHAVGVIHRDLKPDNVVVMPTGDGTEVVKLLDFGVAKLLNRDDEDLGLETAAGSVIGTPAYMSPEQAGGLPVDARADIYSLGAIMYELFCQQPLFRGRSFGEYVRKHLNELPVPPRATAGGAAMDPRLERVILRCLEKDPARRHQTIGELRDDLLMLLAGYETRDPRLQASVRLDALPLQAPPTPPPSRPSGHVTVPPGPPTLPPPALAGPPTPFPTPYPGLHASLGESMIRLDPALVPSPRRRLWLAGGATVAVGAIVAVALVAGARERDEQPAAPPPIAPPTAPSHVIEPAATVEPAPATAATVEPAPRPAMLEVRLDAPEGARVLRAGTGVEVCVAPCRLAIDPADGDSTTERAYLVRLAGFPDQTVRIDLAAPPPELTVRFPATAPPAPATAPAAADVTRSPAARRRPAPTPGVTPPPIAAPAVTPPPAEPPATPRKRPTIDPTDTIDPFAEP